MFAAIEWRWGWVLFLAFALAGVARVAVRWLKRRAAEQWPTTQGLIESVDVKPTKQFLVFSTPRSRARSYTAQLAYSYSVEGNYYSGRYGREFGTETDALEFVCDLQGKHLVVHFKENKPANSALAEQDVETLLQTRAPAPGGAQLRNVPGWVKPLLWPLVLVAAVGFCVSVYFHIDTFLRHRVVPELLFGVLHVGIFVVWFPALFIAQQRLGNLQRKDFWKVLLRGAPDWLRYLMYGFGGYAALMDFMMFFVHSSARRQGDPLLTSRGFSATWMTFYLVGFVILYTAARSEMTAPKCLSGHPAAPGDRFCSRCGQPVRTQGTQAIAR